MLRIGEETPLPKRKFDALQSQTTPSPPSKRFQAKYCEQMEDVKSLKPPCKTINDIMNQPWGFDEISPNDLVLLFKKDGNVLVTRIIKLLDILAAKDPADGARLLQHKWYNALKKTEQFFAHWLELKSAYNHVQAELMNFSTSYRVPVPWRQTADVFYDWLVNFEKDLLRWAIDNDFDVAGLKRRPNTVATQ